MGLRCLVVDDDHSFLTAVRHMLEREGVTTDTAASGFEALERVEQGRPDIVLIDVRLGPEDGFDVMECLAARPRRDGRPLAMVFISNYAEEDFAQRIARSPAMGFLDKSTLSDHLSGATLRELAAARARGHGKRYLRESRNVRTARTRR